MIINRKTKYVQCKTDGKCGLYEAVNKKDKEKRENFKSRCMRDETSTSEYPNADQRLAVCSSQFKNKKEEYSMSDIEKMGDAIKSLTDVISSKAKYGDGSNAKPKKPESEAFIDTSAMEEDDMQKVSRAEDQFDNIDDAKDKAKEIGCVGTHKMDKDGKNIYMPCGTHDAYDEATSKGYGEEGHKYNKKPQQKQKNNDSV